MKILQKCIFLVMPFALSIAYANPLSISEPEINQYLATRLNEKIPLKNSIGIPHIFQLDYQLRDIATKIGQTEEKRVEVMGTINGKLKVKGKQYDVNLSLDLDTIPYYDNEKGAVFLKDIRLAHWAISPEKYQLELQPFISPLAESFAYLLNSNPVYTLDESKTKEALIKKFGKQIIVEKGAIRLETTIF
ncbi:hypothetical protein A6B43_08215 [Vespertiliibacter pulmonis]|uniref:Uncharacterized protein DUF1439 n=1 Tax=Vespertiliibacter pulmonis TaxID=1443036 RepID=A0A3N4VXG6_9PAST|nr:DUF1439 domain-containing protein [Vespertiliibacter pulmonis]QLB21508.1 hypothetical protein A6B43_08215 [Vespertiliibacter pulmonis]RPE85925.1 uncharacterized protein DUF1439 [Vespertiliibacter pulmonis]